MDTILKYLSDIKIVIAIASLAVLLIIWFIIQRIRTNNYKNILEDYEIRYNNIKSVPLSFKLNKAVAISRVESDAMSKVARTKDDFDKAEANLKQISQALADTEDEILEGKLKQAKIDLQDLEACITLGEKQVSELDQFLDTILEKETNQRTEVTELKNRFREIKTIATDNQSQLSYVWGTINKNITDTEAMFSNFEEWMYASDFEKARGELDSIKSSLEKLNESVQVFPALLDNARGVIPNMVESVNRNYNDCINSNIFMGHLDVESNLSLVTNGLKDELEKLKTGDTTDVKEHLDDYKKRLIQLDESVRNEKAASAELESLAKETAEIFNETDNGLKYVSEQYKKLSGRYGLNSLKVKLDENINALKNASANMPGLFAMYQEHTAPCTMILGKMKELNQAVSDCNTSMKSIRAEIDNATGGEDRAKKQLVKLQVIMDQMQVKIRKYKLPSISEQYEEDMRKAYTYINSLERLINETPLNVQLLNATLQEAIDFIYKLYNNVNNVVATVAMVENTIVFGNRYRSTYADIDSELTRSELCFRNGDYTQALTIAIATIEKIHPGNYENMIKENSSSAA